MTGTNENARRQPGAKTSEHYAKNDSAPNSLKQRAKRLIVGLALLGLLPIPAADWLIQHGGLRHE